MSRRPDEHYQESLGELETAVSAFSQGTVDVSTALNDIRIYARSLNMDIHTLMVLEEKLADKAPLDRALAALAAAESIANRYDGLEEGGKSIAAAIKAYVKQTRESFATIGTNLTLVA